MAHVAATEVPPLRPLYTPIRERHSGERACDLAVLPPSTEIPPDLEGAYGIITGIIFGLLAWIGALLPALYVLL